MKNEYPHFKPDKELPKKLDTIRTQNHTTYNINYHIVWIPKYRRKVLANPSIKSILEEIIRGQSEDKDWKVLALEIMPDHIHLFLSVPPRWAIDQVVNQLKGNTSIQLRRIFPELKAKIKKHLWARGYYVSTAGFVSQAQVQKYIEQQTKQMAIKQNRNKQVEKKQIRQQRTLADIPPIPKGMGILSVS